MISLFGQNKRFFSSYLAVKSLWFCFMLNQSSISLNFSLVCHWDPSKLVSLLRISSVPLSLIKFSMNFGIIVLVSTVECGTTLPPLSVNLVCTGLVHIANST